MMENVKSLEGQEWNTEETARIAREAYRYAARTYPKDADMEPLGVADRAVLEAQEAGDWEAFVEALRELMRTARREAQRERVA
jgi:hypothetical protein